MAKKTTKIGRYKVLGELGRGAMGIVYKAEDPNLDRVVALKTIILEADAEGRKEYQKRFFLEAKAAGKLNHPNIVTAFDFGEEDGVAYLAMELVEGADLRQRLKEGAVAPLDAVDIAQQIAEGLGFAHERGIVHRDIKPGNIMLQPRGQAKIMDFGLARMRVADHKTSTGMVLGTPKYMSPEQVAGLPVDQRSDIFSLGIVLYEMLTGVRLFAGADTPQIMHNVVNVEHEPPSVIKPGLPPMLDFVVARALKKDPAVRYQDAYELSADLGSCLAELRGKTDTSSTVADGTKTIRLATGADRATPAPAARDVLADTRLPFSRQFDPSIALDRIARGNAKRLARGPKAVGVLRRLISDPAVRFVFLTSVVAAAAGGWIAFAA
jgi:eukaryotic-like serine/threonine-protein kinase